MELSLSIIFLFLFITCGLGFFYGITNYISILLINTEKNEPGEDRNQITEVQLTAMNSISAKIREGANEFLMREYFYLFIFLILFGGVVILIDGYKFGTAIAFGIGALTSIICSFIGMKVATQTNVKVTYQAASYKNREVALKEAFLVAIKGGIVMGFILVSLALAVLTVLIYAYLLSFKPKTTEEYTKMFEFIAGYGLGGSTVALFCRVGGGIYTKAADVGADLVGKVVLGMDEDSPDNPAVIADNVGDNVGDIAGMGSDLFGSLAESSVAALVVSGTSEEMIHGAYFFPLLLTGAGILVCIITTFFAVCCSSVRENRDIEATLKNQLIISTVLLTPVIAGGAMTLLPEMIVFNKGNMASEILVQNWGIMVCALCGLWSGLIIGYVTDYYTSNSHAPVINLSESCKYGAAINIIRGLALGYMSTMIPITCITMTIYTSFTLAGMYGIAIAALGMLSNLAICLTIDAYGPISDNAGGISEMSELPSEVRNITDALDAAGNTTAAIGKGFAIGSACLVSIALFGAFITRTGLHEVNILEPIEISCIIIGAMIPFAFSAMTMKSVGEAAFKMCKEVKRQVQSGENKNPESKGYAKCIQISTDASLREMILPGVVVLFTPILLGVGFGPKACAGYLAGVIVSGVQMAISSSNSGGAWDNAKKYIEAKRLLYEKIGDSEEEHKEQIGDKMYFTKHSSAHKAAVVGDTVGDPLKDTSGPSLNILIKLSAITCLIFGSFFQNNKLLDL